VQVKSKKNMIVGGLVVLFVGLIWFQFLYSPMQSKASKARTATHEAESSAATLRRTIKLGEPATSKKRGATTDLMLAAIPIDSAQASFLRSVDALRVASGASWQSISPTPPVSNGTVSTVTVAIAVQGTQDQLLSYANGLGKLKRLFVIDNLSMSEGGTTAPPGSTPTPASGGVFASDQLQMQISGRIFGQPAAVGSARGATGAPAPTTGTQSG
jgi:Tfp pilus assembly protein PilO